jgi:hypothetical protein
MVTSNVFAIILSTETPIAEASASLEPKQFHEIDGRALCVEAND